MDTLTHALTGALLARAVVARPKTPDGAAAAAGLAPWQAVVATAAAAAFPDIDAVAQLAGDFAYLRHHRGITHSLLLAPLWAALLALLLSRAFRVTRHPGGWRRLYGLMLGGLLIHLAGDWITQFGTLLLDPLSDQRFGLGAVFIIDLVLTGLVVAALLASAVWTRHRWPAWVGGVAVVGWVLVCWTGRQEALEVGRQYAAAQGLQAQGIDAMARPASPFNWTVVVEDGSRYHLAHVNTRRTAPLVASADDSLIRRFSAPYLPRHQLQWQVVERFGGPGTPAWVREAWGHESLATFRWFAQVPALAKVVDGAPEGRRCAVFEDLRFRTPGRAQVPFRYGLCLAPDGQAPLRVRLDGERLVAL